MAREVRLPRLGQTMQEGTIVNWLVRIGDKVKKGDVIFEIETDKATLEVESPTDGFVKHILAELDRTVPVGAPVLILADKNEKVPQSFIDSLKADLTTVEAPPASTPQLTNQTPQVPLPAETAQPPIPAAKIKLGATIPLNRLQKITAQKMLQSKREMPCFYLSVKADVTDLVELRTKLNRTGDVKISYNDFIMRAVAIGLEKFPIMTGRLSGDTIQLADNIGIGLAVSVTDGLIVPVIKGVHKKNVAAIARDRKNLIEKARNNKLKLTDLEGGCITVSNIGALGIESFIPIVVPGQCSILGVGKITDTAVPEDGTASHLEISGKTEHNFTVRKLMSMTLSVDHKLTNGAYAAQFLDFVRKLLEDTSNFA